MPKPSKVIAPYLSKEEEYESVFLPWSLNMTSGFNVFIPKKDIIYVNISVEDAFQYILTAGGVMPGANIKEDLAKIQEVKAAELAKKQKKENSKNNEKTTGSIDNEGFDKN